MSGRCQDLSLGRSSFLLGCHFYPDTDTDTKSQAKIELATYSFTLWKCFWTLWIESRCAEEFLQVNAVKRSELRELRKMATGVVADVENIYTEIGTLSVKIELPLRLRGMIGEKLWTMALKRL